MLDDTMARQDKGRVAPPPRLGRSAQSVADAVGRLPGVTAQAHWEIGSQTEINGTDFYVGETEVGHIHLDGEAHIALGRAVAQAVVKAKLATKFRWSPAFVVVDTADRDTAVWLFGLRHAQIHGASDAALRAQIDSRTSHTSNTSNTSKTPNTSNTSKR